MTPARLIVSISRAARSAQASMVWSPNGFEQQIRTLF
jgi:hypothetical protein